jgi:salicylate hydroxylase
MAGLMTALALRESGVFTAIDVFEQTRTPSTAGAGLNIPPNGARLAKWLGVDLDGGDPKGPHGAIDGGRAAILSETRMVWEDGRITRKPLDHNTSAGDNAGFHHMHRMDLLMCLLKRALEFAPETGANCPIQVQFEKRLTAVSQDDDSVTVTFADATMETGDLLIGADGVNSQVLEAVWPGVSTKRWTEVVVYRGLAPRDKVAAARKPDGSPLDFNPIETMSMDSRENATAQHLTYWVRGGELLNIWLAYYEPDSAEFEREEGDWFPADRDEMIGNMSRAFAGDPRHDDIVALTGLIEHPTKWGLYDRDALESWTEGRVGLVGDAAHPMLPTYGQGAAQAFEDAAALGKCFELHGTDIYSALLHYERVRYYRATRFQFASKFLFKHLEPKDSPERRAILAAVNERDYPMFDHNERAGTDDSWIYAFDARQIGGKLPIRKLGAVGLPLADRGAQRPPGNRAEPLEAGEAMDRRPALSRARSSHSTRRSTTAGSSSAARCTTSPSGRTTTRRPLRRPYVRRQGRHGGVRRLPQPARRTAHGALLRRAARRSPCRARRRGRRGPVGEDLTGYAPREAQCGRLAARVHAARRQLVPPPGDQPARRRPARRGPLGRRRGRDDRGPSARLRRRRAVARRVPRRRPDPPPAVRRAGGRRATALTG